GLPRGAGAPRSRSADIKRGRPVSRPLWLVRVRRTIVLRLGYLGKFHVLYLDASNGNASVGPGDIGTATERRAVVVVARVAALDAGVLLGWLGNQLGADGKIRAPGGAVIGRLNAIALVAASRIGDRVARRGGGAAIIPGHGYLGLRQGAGWVVVDGDGRHPLGLVLAAWVVVQFDGRGPGDAAIGGTHVEDVPVVTADCSFASVGIVDHVVRTNGWLSPAHVPPDGIDFCEVAAGAGVAHGIEAGTLSGRGPGRAPVGGAIHDVLAGAQTPATLIHAFQKYGAHPSGSRRN